MSVMLTHKVLLTSLVLTMTMVGCKKSTSRNKTPVKKDKGAVTQQVNDQVDDKKSDASTANPAETVTQNQATLATDSQLSADSSKKKTNEQEVNPNPSSSAPQDQVTAGDGNGTATAGDGNGTATAGDDKGTATAGDDKGTATAGDDKGPATAGDDKGTAIAGDDKGTAIAGDGKETATAGDGKETATAKESKTQYSFGRGITIESSMLDLAKQTVNLDSCKTEVSRSEVKIYQYSSEGLQRHVFILKALARNSQNEQNPLYFISEIDNSLKIATTRSTTKVKQHSFATAYVTKISTGDIVSQNTQLKLTSVDGGQILNSSKSLQISSIDSKSENSKTLIRQICSQVTKNNFLGLFQQKRFSVLKDVKSNIVDVLVSSIKVGDKVLGVLLQLKRYQNGANTFIMTIHQKGSNDLKKSVQEKVIGDVRIENGNKGQSLVLVVNKMLSANIDLARIYQTDDGKVVFSPIATDGKFLQYDFKGLIGGYVNLAQENSEKLP